MAHIHVLEDGTRIIRNDWYPADIKEYALDNYGLVLTIKEINQIMDAIVRGFDAERGISWSEIDFAISQMAPVN